MYFIRPYHEYVFKAALEDYDKGILLNSDSLYNIKHAVDITQYVLLFNMKNTQIYAN